MDSLLEVLRFRAELDKYTVSIYIVFNILCIEQKLQIRK